jgi:hypothetical protein
LTNEKLFLKKTKDHYLVLSVKKIAQVFPAFGQLKLGKKVNA